MDGDIARAFDDTIGAIESLRDKLANVSFWPRTHEWQLRRAVAELRDAADLVALARALAEQGFR